MNREVYFIKPVGLSGPIKIGCSEQPVGRLMALAIWSPFPLELITTLPGDLALERNIQECFADVHSHGEWFHPVSRLTAAIEQIRAGVPVGDAIDLSDRRGNIFDLRMLGRWAA